MNASCVISQVPFVGGPESTKKNVLARGVTGVLRILHTYLKDSLRGLLGWDAGVCLLLSLSYKGNVHACSPTVSSLLISTKPHLVNPLCSKQNQLQIK
jgi:hypothetical protein